MYGPGELYPTAPGRVSCSSTSSPQARTRPSPPTPTPPSAATLLAGVPKSSSSPSSDQSRFELWSHPRFEDVTAPPPPASPPLPDRLENGRKSDLSEVKDVWVPVVEAPPEPARPEPSERWRRRLRRRRQNQRRKATPKVRTARPLTARERRGIGSVKENLARAGQGRQP